MSAVTKTDGEGFQFVDIQTPRGVEKDVLLLEGMLMSNGERLYSMFDSVELARHPMADERCFGTIGGEVLTEELRAIAAKNSELL
jgi:hypothetical protein